MISQASVVGVDGCSAGRVHLGVEKDEDVVVERIHVGMCADKQMIAPHLLKSPWLPQTLERVGTETAHACCDFVVARTILVLASLEILVVFDLDRKKPLAAFGIAESDVDVESASVAGVPLVAAPWRPFELDRGHVRDASLGHVRESSGCAWEVVAKFGE